jgi:hypothetical protein
MISVRLHSGLSEDDWLTQANIAEASRELRWRRKINWKCRLNEPPPDSEFEIARAARNLPFFSSVGD